MFHKIFSVLQKGDVEGEVLGAFSAPQNRSIRSLVILTEFAICLFLFIYSFYYSV